MADMMSSQRDTRKGLKSIVIVRTRKLDGLGGKEQKQFAPGRATTVTNSIIAGEVATISGKQLIPMVPMLPF